MGVLGRGVPRPYGSVRNEWKDQPHANALSIEPGKVKQFTTDQLRDEFLINRLFSDDALTLTYSHIDRVIVGGACPVTKAVELTASPKDLGAGRSLSAGNRHRQRRRRGEVTVDGRITRWRSSTACTSARARVGNVQEQRSGSSGALLPDQRPRSRQLPDDPHPDQQRRAESPRQHR